MSIVKKSFTLAATFFLCISTALPVISSAENLYITDDYLNELDDEVSSPEYLEKAKQELRETEVREQSGAYTNVDIQKALISVRNFESLIRTEYPSSYSIYSTLTRKSRVFIFDQFKTTKQLSTAKRLIIEKFLVK